MTLYGCGRAAIVDDRPTAERLQWPRRRRGLPDPEIVLSPREGDPQREPWLVPGWMEPSRGVELLWRPRRRAASCMWSYIAGVPGVVRYLRGMACAGPKRGARVAIAGLGRVGGTATAGLAALPSTVSGISDLLICDVDAANEARWLRELDAVHAWRPKHPGPAVRVVSPTRVFLECDVFLFCAAVEVPGLGAREDVRLTQLDPNRRVLAPYLEAAVRADYQGLFLIVSDPVELLAQAAFRDSNSERPGGFHGKGLAPERIAGLALGVMWARAVGRARREGWGETVRRRGGAYGPHSLDVVVFDNLTEPDRCRSRILSEAAGTGNLEVRGVGYLPYVGPAYSSVVLALPGLLRGAEVLASPFIDGIYYGAPVRCEGGVYPSPHRMSGEARRVLEESHEKLRRRVHSLGLGF